MLAVGNDELGESVHKGDTIKNEMGQGILEYGIGMDGKESSRLGFITIRDVSYLVSIGNQLLNGCEKVIDL